MNKEEVLKKYKDFKVSRITLVRETGIYKGYLLLELTNKKGVARYIVVKNDNLVFEEFYICGREEMYSVPLKKFSRKLEDIFIGENTCSDIVKKYKERKRKV
jgi:hypothetical protein